MSDREEADRISAEISRRRRSERRARRKAALVWLLAGGAVGTCLYLLWTRFRAFSDGARWPGFGLFVLMTVGLVALATRFEKDARTAAEAIQELEERLERLGVR